jgi:hypothetical protein
MKVYLETSFISACVTNRTDPSSLHRIARAEYLLSWNVKHLANPNKRLHLARICMRFRHIPPAIITPDFLWEK